MKKSDTVSYPHDCNHEHALEDSQLIEEAILSQIKNLCSLSEKIESYMTYQAYDGMTYAYVLGQINRVIVSRIKVLMFERDQAFMKVDNITSEVLTNSSK